MAKRRKSIRPLDHEKRLLLVLYERWRIPSDQYESRPDDLEGFCEEWRGLTGRKETNEEILHYLRNRRKSKKSTGGLPTFGGDHQVAPPLPPFTPEEVVTLRDIYREVVASAGEGSDNIAYDGATAQEIARRFAEATGRIVPAHLLCAKVTAIRKRGLLPPVEQQQDKPDDIGFDDIDLAQ